MILILKKSLVLEHMDKFSKQRRKVLKLVVLSSKFPRRKSRIKNDSRGKLRSCRVLTIQTSSNFMRHLKMIRTSISLWKCAKEENYLIVSLIEGSSVKLMQELFSHRSCKQSIIAILRAFRIEI